MLDIIVMAAASATAACVADTPVALAESLQANAYTFYVYPDLARPYVSDAMHAALLREAACETDLCALSADPWIDAQDGDIVGDVIGRERSRSPDGASVALCFDVAMGDTAQQCATITVVRNAAGCWVVDDLVAASGRSLRKTLAEYPYDSMHPYDPMFTE